MKKLTIVINGVGGVGKDTLCDLAAKHFSVCNISSITPIKEIAGHFGWNGGKTDKDRKFLSDLKALAIGYNDFPTAWATARYREFLASDAQILFVHIREGEEIAKFVRATGGEAKTLLIRGGSRFAHQNGAYGNVSDDLVENYPYDYYYVNEKSLPEAEAEFTALLNEMVKETNV